jgi:hypothetical protein
VVRAPADERGHRRVHREAAVGHHVSGNESSLSIEAKIIALQRFAILLPCWAERNMDCVLQDCF